MNGAVRILGRSFVTTLVVSALFVAFDGTRCRASDAWSADGYFKSFVACVTPVETGYTGASRHVNPSWMTAHRARTNATIYASDRVSFLVSYELSLRVQDNELLESEPFVTMQSIVTGGGTYRIDDLDRTVWPDHPDVDDRATLFQNLDRAYVAIRGPAFDIYIGRQAIAWGSAHAINPTDIISPFLFTDVDTEDRPGADAIRLRVPVGALGELDAGYVAGEKCRREESAAYVRGKFYAAKTDFAFVGAAFCDNAMAGVDVTRAIGGAGTWCEAAYVWAGAFDGGKNRYLRLSSGADYSFGTGVYAFVELHYNGAGHDAPDRYLNNVVSNDAAYRHGSVYLLGRYYVVPGVSWQVVSLATLFAETLVNVSDGSLILAPSLEYNVTDNLYVSVGGYAGIGKKPEISTSSIILHSEFGAYPDQYYGFVRYYF